MAKDNMEDYKKKYEDIIEKVKNLLNKSKDIGVNIIRIQDIEDTIPELKESEDEDERIKKIIKNTLQSYNRGIVFGCLNAKDYSDCLAWLEKQGEQKSAWTPMDEQHVENLLALIEGHGYPGEVAWLNSLEDRVQPKQGEQKPAIKLERDENGEPILTPFEAGLFSMMSEAWQGYSFGEEVNLAKIVKEHSIELLERANEQKPAEWGEEDERIYDSIIYDIHKDLALTSKQKNWFKSLKYRVGCEADCTTTKDWSEEDELRMENILSVIEGHGYPMEVEWIKSLKDRVQPQSKQEWSKDDEYYRNIIMYCLNGECVGNADKKNAVLWLKSLRPQPQQEWDEEDERKISRIYSILRQASDTHAFSTTCRLIGDKECIELQDFLKSLRPQKRWKPSEGQMESITCAVRNMKESACYDSEMVSLLNDLKKLKE